MSWLPRYTKNDLRIYAVCMPVMVATTNLLLFGGRYFIEPEIFIFSGALVLFFMSVGWYAFLWVAVTVRNRFPSGKEIVKRLVITTLLIGTLASLVITLFFYGYSSLHLFEYEFSEVRYYWAIVIALVLTILITMVHEGLDSFDRWKATLIETEKLKTSYAQTQLFGLKSQVNPHFLFNCLNSLSSLIHEDSDKAESFLNELTKVYRYLLARQEEKLVLLATELQFIRSYFYLLHTRYGERVALETDISEEAYSLYVSPYLLLTVFEYALNNNALKKGNPLLFKLSSGREDSRLLIRYNMQEKQHVLSVGAASIENLVDKYKLICTEEVRIEKTGGFFVLSVPLLTAPQIVKYEIG